MGRPERMARRLTAATLCLALGWPLTARATRGPGPHGAEAPTATEGERPKDAAGPGAGPSTNDAGSEREPPQDAADSEAGPSTSAAGSQAADGTDERGPEAELPPPQPPQPQPTVELTSEQLAQRLLDVRVEKAEIHWQEGQRLYNNGRYAEAAVEFERSYEAVPAAATLYSVALSYERAGKPVEAVRALKRYLALRDCPTDVPPEQRPIDCATQRPVAEQMLAEQRSRVGELRLDLGEGVKLREVRVAGRTVPLDDFPHLLLPGTVDVEVFGLGPDERRSRPAYITAGETYELYVAPFEEEGPPPPVVPPGPDEAVDLLRLARQQRQLKTAFWVGTGLTASSGITLAVMTGITRYHQQRFNTEKCPNPCVELDEQGNPVLDEQGRPIPKGTAGMPLYPANHEEAVARYKPVVNAMLGVTIGLGVATALVGAFAFRKLDGARTGGPPRARAHVRLGGSGLVVRW